MTQAQQGDTVRVHYTGRFDDGTVFDSSQGRDPLQFTVGQRQVIPGFEQAVDGLSVGESVTTRIPASDAYGTRDETLVFQVSPDSVPQDVKLKTGDRLQIRGRDGRTMIVTVTEITPSSVTLDGNHPMAGKDLTFDIRLVAIG